MAVAKLNPRKVKRIETAFYGYISRINFRTESYIFFPKQTSEYIIDLASKS